MSGVSFEHSELSLEPTIQLDQMSRYLNHLHELRRINEGDDIADSPGYALNLVRIPVSVLPGRQTRKGYGAEITITAEPYLSDELLPTTFRNLVINDVVDQLAYPMTRVVNSFDKDLKERLRSISKHHFFVSTNPELRELSDRLCGSQGLSLKEATQAYERVREEDNPLLKSLLAVRVTKLSSQKLALAVGDATAENREARNEEVITGLRKGLGLDTGGPSVNLSHESKAAREQIFGVMERQIKSDRYAVSPGEIRMFHSGEPQDLTTTGYNVGTEIAPLSTSMSKSADRLKEAYEELRQVFSTDLVVTVPASRSRRARMPLPPSQLLATYDLVLLAHVAADALGGLEGNPVDRQRLHLMDVRGFMLEEVEGAYEYLMRPENQGLWEACNPFPAEGKLSLASAVRSRDVVRIEEIRRKYLVDAGVSSGIAGLADGDTTRSLAWAILVQASLLNDRLVRDIKEATETKGCPHCFADVEMMHFYLPAPFPEARMAFNEYVKCRWPIQVFALDPVTQEQNVADEFSRRRELQVAAALAFAGGNMRAQALTRFSRRLEWDMATIALNRTVVAFSHGNDTFGWRFQPRFQTPPTPGTLQAIGETLLGGPTRDCDMSQRELESGLRECTAIVVMPSFVPYATFDVRTNWYKLTDPKCTEMSMRETMELSRAITSMRSSAAQCAQCAHLYREGEVARMLRRVDQLDRELPLQTMRVQIPYENTSGGFEMFNRGITELAPELIGWYGAPGVDLQNPTTMFLVGDGFSVHDTRVIAGGRVVPFKLISRQLMQVEIPTGLQVLQRGRSEPGGEFNPASLEEIVDVHLATPYGVSSHLLVPVANAGPAPAVVHFEMVRGGNFELTYTSPSTIDDFFRFNQETLVIRAPRLAEISGDTTVTFYIQVAGNGTYLGTFDIESVR